MPRRWLLPRVRRASLDEEVRDEVDAHLALAVEYLMARGLPRQEAERRARERFGDFDQAMRRIHESARRREDRVARREWLAELRQDATVALRQFRRAPAFFVGIVLTIAIGVGANGVVFSILQAALLQPLPYRAPDELVMAWRTSEHPSAPPPGVRKVSPRRGLLTSPTLLGWRRSLHREVGEVAGLLSWQGNREAQFDVVLGDRAERLNGAFVTPNFFELLGARAARGRLFAAADERSDAPLLVLSDALWRRDFGADSSIVGRAVTLTVGLGPRGPRTFTVVGVLPPRFRFTYPEETEAWALMPWSEVERRDPRAIGLRAVARLRPGVTLERALARVRPFPEGVNDPDTPPEYRDVLVLQPIRDWVVGEVRPALRLLAAVAALLLLITCATVANALLARVSARQRELAVRSALGAGRGRIVRQLLAEGALLTVAGAVAGTALAAALQPLLRALLPAAVPRVGELGLGAPLLAFAAAVAALTTILSTLAPAWGGAGGGASGGASELVRGGHGASANRATRRWRLGLVGVQGTIATALLVCASLLLASLWRLGHVPLGFDGERVLTVEVRPLDPRFRDEAVLRRFQEELLRNVRAIPGVEAAGLTSAVPFRGVDIRIAFGRPGLDKVLIANGRFVDPGYFDVLRVALARGRLLDDGDREGARRVAVVSESFAREVFGAEDAVGKTILFDGPLEIVGLVRDVRYDAPENDPRPAVYLPIAQSPSGLMCVVARARGGERAVGPALQRAIREVEPAVLALGLTTIDRIVGESTATRRFYTIATVVFAGLALVLTTAGLATVVARVVTERRRELAIRGALGAPPLHLTRLASRDALAAVGAGVVFGTLAARAGAALLADFLFEVPPASAVAYGGVAGVVLAVAAVAAWLPARRVLRTPLAATLREA